jgi:hypothetical protein
MAAAAAVDPGYSAKSGLASLRQCHPESSAIQRWSSSIHDLPAAAALDVAVVVLCCQYLFPDPPVPHGGGRLRHRHGTTRSPVGRLRPRLPSPCDRYRIRRRRKRNVGTVAVVASMQQRQQHHRELVGVVAVDNDDVVVVVAADVDAGPT